MISGKDSNSEGKKTKKKEFLELNSTHPQTVGREVVFPKTVTGVDLI